MPTSAPRGHVSAASPELAPLPPPPRPPAGVRQSPHRFLERFPSHLSGPFCPFSLLEVVEGIILIKTTEAFFLMGWAVGGGVLTMLLFPLKELEPANEIA